MPLAAIFFPHLSPVLYRFGPVSVRWYGAAYLTAFMFGYVTLRQMGRAGYLRLTADALGDLIGWLVSGVMVGGRAGWWLFYHCSHGTAEPWYEPVAVWHGGMSFHGGLIGVVAAAAIWCRRTRTPAWNLVDALAWVAPVGLFLGRLANFVNAELVGRPTSLPWGVVFPGDPVPRHPSQLYEALLEGPALLLVLWLAFRHRRSVDGRVAALFMLTYGTFRFAVEFTREPDPQIGFVAFGWLTTGQLLSIGLVAIGVVLAAVLGRRLPAVSGPTTGPFHMSQHENSRGEVTSLRLDRSARSSNARRADPLGCPPGSDPATCR